MGYLKTLVIALAVIGKIDEQNRERGLRAALEGPGMKHLPFEQPEELYNAIATGHALQSNKDRYLFV